MENFGKNFKKNLKVLENMGKMLRENIEKNFSDFRKNLRKFEG